MKNESKEADYAYLVFMYGLPIVDNILNHMEHCKDEPLKVPDRYQVIAQDCADYYNRWNSNTAKLRKKSNG